MKSQEHARAGVIRQEFAVPAGGPLLEIRTTHDSTHPYAPHSHRTFSVGLILKGRTAFTCDGVRHVVGENDIVLIEPEAAHQCNPVEGKPRSYHMLHLEPGWCLEQAGATAEARSLRPRQRAVRDMAVALELREAVEALGQEQSGAERRLERALAGLLRVWCLPVETGEGNERFDAECRLLGLSQTGESPSVAEVARKTGMRREAFIRAFRRETGLSPGAYRHCARLEEGRRLLRQGRSIAETAQLTGYADQSHFHRMFVKFFSATPRQYRRGGLLSFKK